MPKIITKTEEKSDQPISAHLKVKQILLARAKDMFEREPQNAFVMSNVDKLVADITNLFN